MKRWALCQWVDDPEEPGTRMPAVGLYDASYAIVGGIANPWVLTRLSTNNLGPINSDNRIIVFPDITRDAQANTMPLGIWNALKAKAVAAGFEMDGVKTSESFGIAITHIGRQLVANFVDTEVDVSE